MKTMTMCDTAEINLFYIPYSFFKILFILFIGPDDLCEIKKHMLAIKYSSGFLYFPR